MNSLNLAVVVFVLGARLAPNAFCQETPRIDAGPSEHGPSPTDIPPLPPSAVFATIAPVLAPLAASFSVQAVATARFAGSGSRMAAALSAQLAQPMTTPIEKMAGALLIRALSDPAKMTIARNRFKPTASRQSIDKALDQIERGFKDNPGEREIFQTNLATLRARLAAVTIALNDGSTMSAEKILDHLFEDSDAARAQDPSAATPLSESPQGAGDREKIQLGLTPYSPHASAGVDASIHKAIKNAHFLRMIENDPTLRENWRVLSYFQGLTWREGNVSARGEGKGALGITMVSSTKVQGETALIIEIVNDPEVTRYIETQIKEKAALVRKHDPGFGVAFAMGEAKDRHGAVQISLLGRFGTANNAEFFDLLTGAIESAPSHIQKARQRFAAGELSRSIP